MARSKDKHQINVSVAENIKAIYQAMSDVSGMNSRVVQAGMIWLLEHPEKRQEAMDRLLWLEQDPAAPRSQKECEEYVRGFGVITRADAPAEERFAAGQNVLPPVEPQPVSAHGHEKVRHQGRRRLAEK